LALFAAVVIPGTLIVGLLGDLRCLTSELCQQWHSEINIFCNKS